MLASVLPGLREVRAALAAGYVYLLVLWLWFAGCIGDLHDEGGVLGELADVGDTIGHWLRHSGAGSTFTTAGLRLARSRWNVGHCSRG